MCMPNMFMRFLSLWLFNVQLHTSTRWVWFLPCILCSSNDFRHVLKYNWVVSNTLHIPACIWHIWVVLLHHLYIVLCLYPVSMALLIHIQVSWSHLKCHTYVHECSACLGSFQAHPLHLCSTLCCHQVCLAISSLLHMYWWFCVHIHICMSSNAMWLSACVWHACTAPGLNLVVSLWVQQASCTFLWSFDMYRWFSLHLQLCPCLLDAFK